jgi:hypothetical protein
MAANGLTSHPQVALPSQMLVQITACPDREGLSSLASILSGSLLQIVTTCSRHLRWEARARPNLLPGQPIRLIAVIPEQAHVIMWSYFV